MAKYTLYGTKMIENDSSMESFAKSLLKNLDMDYQINHEEYDNEMFEDFTDEIQSAIYEFIHDDLSRTDINYQELMERFAKDIGQLLYDMENRGYDFSGFNLSFFDNAKESFETLLYTYIQIHFDELKEVCLCK